MLWTACPSFCSPSQTQSHRLYKGAFIPLPWLEVKAFRWHLSASTDAFRNAARNRLLSEQAKMLRVSSNAPRTISNCTPGSTNGLSPPAAGGGSLLPRPERRHRAPGWRQHRAPPGAAAAPLPAHPLPRQPSPPPGRAQGERHPMGAGERRGGGAGGRGGANGRRVGFLGEVGKHRGRGDSGGAGGKGPGGRG